MDFCCPAVKPESLFPCSLVMVSCRQDSPILTEKNPQANLEKENCDNNRLLFFTFDIFSFFDDILCFRKNSSGCCLEIH